MQWTFRAEYIANRSLHSHDIASPSLRHSHLSSIGIYWYVDTVAADYPTLLPLTGPDGPLLCCHPAPTSNEAAIVQPVFIKR